MTGFSDREQAAAFAALLPDPPPGDDFDWPAFLHDEIEPGGYDLSDIRLIHTEKPAAFQLLGNAVEKWVAYYDAGWQVRAWEGSEDEFAEGDWNEDLSDDD